VSGRATSAPSDPAAQGETFDPGAHTVDEVKTYAAAHPDELDAVYAAEQSGKARSTLLEWLAARGTP
jgi:hypothetical protein